MHLSHSGIIGLIPHKGAMCLLDEVCHYDSDSVTCISNSHLRPDHPLRKDGMLSAIHALEYAAQAMAVHGALMARSCGTPIAPGLMVALSDTRVLVERLDTLKAPLVVSAQRIVLNHASLIYRFEMFAGEIAIADGRAIIMCRTKETA